MELRLYFQTYTTVLLLVFYVSIASLSSVHIKYVRHSLSPARLSQPYDNVDGVSLLTCSALCSIGENCFGISFHRLISRCELVNKTEYFGEYQTNNDGWRVYGNVIADTIYTPCSSGEDCLDPYSRCVSHRISSSEAESLCYCQPLFQYKPDKRRCEQVCGSLGSSFTMHEDMFISWFSIWRGEVTLADCKQKCLQQGDSCLSFDYRHSDSKCRLNSISLHDATDSGYLRSEVGDDLYTKDCGD